MRVSRGKRFIFALTSSFILLNAWWQGPVCAVERGAEVDAVDYDSMLIFDESFLRSLIVSNDGSDVIIPCADVVVMAS